MHSRHAAHPIFDQSCMARGAESGSAAMERPAGELMPGMEMPAGEWMPGMEMPGAAAPAAGAMAGMDHGSMKMRDFSVTTQVDKNPGVQTISPMPSDRMGEPGPGLATVGHKVLPYHAL